MSALDWFFNELQKEIGFVHMKYWDKILEKYKEAKILEKEDMSYFYYLERLTADVEIGKDVGWDFEEEYKKKYKL